MRNRRYNSLLIYYLLVLGYSIIMTSCNSNSNPNDSENDFPISKISVNQNTASPEKYNVVWDSPGKNALGSMPIGNGDIGLNVWIEENGDLCFYIGKSDAWSGNGRLLKMGRIRIRLFPNPFSRGVLFKQTLNLSEGSIDIIAGEDKYRCELSLWVDANKPVVHVEVESREDLELEVNYEYWRKNKRLIAPANLKKYESGESFSAMGVTGRDPIYQYPDEIMREMDNRITWFHRNAYSVYPMTMNLQGLGDLMKTFPDPLLDLTFGGTIKGKGLRSVDAQKLASSSPARQHKVSIYLHTEQSETIEAWKEELDKYVFQVENIDLKSAKSSHKLWWHKFWERSWIHVSGGREAEVVSQGYQLQRYMNACGGRGAYPIHFNGSIFTIDMIEDWPEMPKSYKFDADYRRWGSCYWLNNTRAIYWSFLSSGDFDLMLPLFKMYRDILPLAKLRTPRYFNHEGAFMPETVTFWGTQQNEAYGWDREGKSPGFVKNPYLKYHLSGGLELSSLMLEYYTLKPSQAFAEDIMLPFASSIITFYDQHYKRDEKGKIFFSPGQALETWWDCDNPLPEIAGLKFVLNQLLSIQGISITQNQRDSWKQLLNELPEIPSRILDGDTILAPAQRFADLHNSENAELYAIHPYRLYGIGKPHLAMARKTFDQRLFKVMENERPGYHPDPIQAAYLGLTELAKKYVFHYFNYNDPTIPFKGFFKAADDWFPNQQTGNTAMTGLQKMIMHTDGKKIILLPTWPKEWDLKFKLHAPNNTIVEGQYQKGNLVNLKVTPKYRSKDVELAQSPMDSTNKNYKIYHHENY